METAKIASSLASPVIHLVRCTNHVKWMLRRNIRPDESDAAASNRSFNQPVTAKD
jgi:hypothetical protein